MTIGFIVYFVIMYDRGFWMITRGNDSIVRMICELELNVFFLYHCSSNICSASKILCSYAKNGKSIRKTV